MIRFFFIRFILPLLLFLLVRALLKTIFAASRSAMSPQTASKKPPPTPTGGELKKDPVCGTYVSAGSSITRTINGQLHYFCSAECRDKYRVA
jgi:YHS domain-containing protein